MVRSSPSTLSPSVGSTSGGRFAKLFLAGARVVFLAWVAVRPVFWSKPPRSSGTRKSFFILGVESHQLQSQTTRCHYGGWEREASTVWCVFGSNDACPLLLLDLGEAGPAVEGRRERLGWRSAMGSGHSQGPELVLNHPDGDLAAFRPHNPALHHKLQRGYVRQQRRPGNGQFHGESLGQCPARFKPDAAAR